jgi:uncharacterized SAM-binding protein YcdF (DUF218 family)
MNSSIIDETGKEPRDQENRRTSRQVIFKWTIFVIFILYILISYLKVPILTGLGGYLIKRDVPEKADVILCLAGGNVERGLAAADAYHEGLAPLIFITRESLPVGYERLMEKGLDYPESVDLLRRLLKRLGVPESAILTSDTFVGSTIDEARLMRGVVEKRGFLSLIIISSPMHTRRAWLTFRKIFKDSGVKITMLPSTYSGFRPGDWWKSRGYVREVIIEYEKLLYYRIKYLL